MKKGILVTGLLCFSALSSLSQASTQHLNVSDLSIPFIQNEGQVSSDIQFYAKTFYGTTAVDKNGVISYYLTGKNQSKLFTESFEAKGIPVVKPLKEAKTTVNYFKGKKHFSHLKTFKSVEVENIANGVDLELKAYAQKVEKIFKIKPGFSPSEIKVNLKGVKDIKVNSNGELELLLGKETAKFTKPIAYQFINGKKKFVKVSYKKLDNDSYSFVVGNYDKSKTLFIDPLLTSTYLGGSDNDIIIAMTKDNSGNIFVTGKTKSDDFPVLGGYDTVYHGNDKQDVFVAKLDSNLKELKAATYIGGSKEDKGHRIRIDSNGDVIVSGMTESIFDFPTTSNLDGANLHNKLTGFVLKLDNNLSSLKVSSLFGGSRIDWVLDMALDNNDNIYIAGYTTSINFPTTSNTYQPNRKSRETEGYIIKVSNDISTILSSTYLGGSHRDKVYGIDIDPQSGDIFVVGRTESDDFPTTSNAYDTNYSNKPCDAFVARLDSNLENLKASTYLGGSGDDRGFDIKITQNFVYVDGFTSSRDFPVTNHAYDKTYNGGYHDTFVSKFDKNLQYLIASTYLGGYGDDRAYNFGIDEDGNVYVIGGFSQSKQFPVTTGAFQDSSEDYTDSFIAKLSPNLDKLIASTYLGGNGKDEIWDILIDDNVIYVAGGTGSNNFPVDTKSYDVIYNGGSNDGFISKFDKSLSALSSDPMVVNFGTVTADEDEVSKKITLKNAGKSKLNITKIKIKGLRDDEFEIEDDNCSGITLYPQEKCSFDLYFEPDEAGNKKGEVVVYIDGKPSYTIPVESITLKKKDDGDDGFDTGDDGVDFGYIQDSACSMVPVSSGALPLYLLIPFLIGLKKGIKRLFRK